MISMNSNSRNYKT